MKSTRRRLDAREEAAEVMRCLQALVRESAFASTLALLVSGDGQGEASLCLLVAGDGSPSWGG